MAVVKYKTKMFHPREGVCSTWLSSLSPYTDTPFIKLWVTKGTILFPKDVTTPVIMVGPGETIFYFWYLSIYFVDVYYLTLWDIYYEISLQISPPV